MKRLKKNTVIALLMVAVVGVSGCGIKIGIKKPSGSTVSTSDRKVETSSEVDVNKALEIKNINDVDIKISVAELTIRSTDGDKLTVVSTGNKKYPQLKVYSSGDNIIIYDEDKNEFSNITGPNVNINRKVVIEVPRSFKGNMDIKTGVGSTLIKDISLKDVTIKGGVGGMDIEDITFENLKVKQGVGEVQMTLNAIEGNIKYEGGIGSAFISIPDNSPVNIKTESGLGECKVNAKTSSEGKYEFDLKSGIGEIKVTSH